MDLANTSSLSHFQPPVYQLHQVHQVHQLHQMHLFESPPPPGTKTSAGYDTDDETSASESEAYDDYEETASEIYSPLTRPNHHTLATQQHYSPASWELELEGLTHTLHLKADKEDQIDGTSESKEWLEPERDVDASCSTERLVVNALEYSTDQDRVTLVCPEGPQARVVDPKSIQLRWL